MTESDETVPEQSEQLDLQPEEMLMDTGRDDMLDGGYEVPDHWSAAQGFGNTPEEQAVGETLEQRLAQEEPEVSPEAYGAGLHEAPTGTHTSALDSDVTELDLVGQEDLDNTAEDVHASVAGGSLEAVLDPELDDLEDDPSLDGLVTGTDYLDDGEVGDEQVVRLVEPGEGFGPDTESQMVGLDVGGTSEQSAEEAAIHVVPDNWS